MPRAVGALARALPPPAGDRGAPAPERARDVGRRARRVARHPPVAGAELLRLHSRGPAVATAQRALGVAADGEFGPLTRAAVLAFQRAHGLEADGVVGPVTSAALGMRETGGGPAPSPSTTRALQGKRGLAADGVYGPVTRAAVVEFQRSHGLEVDGVVGPQTLGALGLSGAGTAAGSSALSAARS
jgi:peptidoglycan hydrolase-like protein with peptidoglycan-binding domain